MHAIKMLIVLVIYRCYKMTFPPSKLDVDCVPSLLISFDNVVTPKPLRVTNHDFFSPVVCDMRI